LVEARDLNNETALTLASEFGSKETVELLIGELNADIHATNDSGYICFFSAFVGAKIETLRYLHSVDSSLCQQTDNNGNTVWNLVRSNTTKACIEFLFNIQIPMQVSKMFEEEECVICYTEKPIHVFMPCRHKCVCESCLKIMVSELKGKCPMSCKFSQIYCVN